MAVIYWQLSIVATIAIANFLVMKNFLKPGALLVVCGAWSLFTLVKLIPPLMIVQLFVIWGSYFLFKHIETKGTETSNLRQALAALSEEQRNNIATMPAKSKQFLSGVEHYDYLLKSLRSTQHKIVILSGWLSSYVIDEQFVSLLTMKLRQGVRFSLDMATKIHRGGMFGGMLQRKPLPI